MPATTRTTDPAATGLRSATDLDLISSVRPVCLIDCPAWHGCDCPHDSVIWPPYATPAI